MNTNIAQQSSQCPPQQEKTKIYLAAYFCLSLLSWLLTIKATGIASMWIGAEHFGDFSVSLKLAHNLTHLFVMGQEATLLMYLSQYHEQPLKQSGLIRWIIKSTLTKSFVLLSTVALFMLIPSLNQGLEYLGIRISPNYWLGFICIPFIVASGIYERFFMFMQQFFTSFLSRGIYQPILFISAVWGLQQYIDASASSALILYALTCFLAASLYALQAFLSPFTIASDYDQSNKKDWQLSGLYYTFSTLIIKSSPSIALFFLESIGTNELSVGYFSAILTLIYGFHLLTKPFDSYLKPAIAKLYAKGEVDLLQDKVNYINKVRWLVIAALFIGLALGGEHLLAQYGETYHQSYYPLLTFSFLTAVQYMGQPANEILNYTGFQKKLSIIMAVQLFFIAALSKLLIPAYGLWGAVFAQGIPCAIATFVSATTLRRNTKIKAYIIF